MDDSLPEKDRINDQKLTEEGARAQCEEQKETLMAALELEQRRLAAQIYYKERPAWARELDLRQWGLVQHCRSYVNEGMHGLPGHQLMIVVDKLAVELETAAITPEQKEVIEFEHWLHATFGKLVRGDTVKERVWSVIRHYVTQMARWTAFKDDD